MTQIQDIAGRRIILDYLSQNIAIYKIKETFEKTKVFDRRINPSRGYRAVHLVVNVDGKLVEIQVRSQLQHLWAEISELFAVKDIRIKYGDGDSTVLSYLNKVSGLIEKIEIVSFKELINLAGKSMASKKLDYTKLNEIRSIEKELTQMLKNKLKG